MNHTKTIDHPALNGAVARQQSNRRAEIRIARSFDDLLMVYSVRSGTAREGLEGFWARFGGVTISDKKITVSGFKYTEMMVDLDSR